MKEKQGRFATFGDCLNKTDLDDVNGYSGLLTIISNITSDEEAIQILNLVEELAFPNNLYNCKIEWDQEQIAVQKTDRTCRIKYRTFLQRPV